MAFLIWYGWTVTAWLAKGPHEITQFRTGDTIGEWSAHVVEVMLIVFFLWWSWRLLRKCMRERRLTFDAMFWVAGMLIWLDDVGINFLQPIFLPSSNFTNLNAPAGSAPFWINPDVGRMPDPFIVGLVGNIGFIILTAYLSVWLLRRIRVRSGAEKLSRAKEVFIILSVGIVLDLAIELPGIRFFHWWNYAPGNWAIELGGPWRYALHEVVGGGVWVAVSAMVWIFKDDRGHTVVERGLDHLRPKRRTGVIFLATVGILQTICWTFGTIPVLLYGLYSSVPWNSRPPQPRYIVNAVCDAPGFSGTRYGPCPGSPGYRMPIRSLPGPRPH